MSQNSYRQYGETFGYEDELEEDLERHRSRVSPGKRTLTMNLAAQEAPPIQGKDIDLKAATRGDMSSVKRSGGAAMPKKTQALFEAAFNTDFGDVRVHTGDSADQLGAKAFTQGNDIHFAPGRYAPDSSDGKALLGHELTHVVQQRAGTVATQGKDGMINADVSLEAEADTLGAAAARGESVQVRGATSAARVQRAKGDNPVGDVQLELHNLEARVVQRLKDITADAAAAAAVALLQDKFDSMAKAAAKKEAGKLAGSVVEKRKTRADGSLKGEVTKVVNSEAAELGKDGGRQLADGDTVGMAKKRGYAAGKAAGKAAAADTASAVATLVAETIKNVKVGGLVLDVSNAVKLVADAAVEKAVTQQAIVMSQDPITQMLCGSTVNSALQMRFMSTWETGGLAFALQDPALRSTSETTAEKLGVKTKKALEKDLKQGMADKRVDNTKDVRESAVNAGKAAAKYSVNEGVAEAGVGPKMRALATGVEAVIPDAGDAANIELEFSIPAGPGFVTIKLDGSVARAGGSGNQSESFVTTKMQMMVGYAGNVIVAKAVAEIGGYVESCGASAAHAFEQISYSLFRRFRESSVIPSGLVDALWSSKGISANEWADGVEKRLIKSDLAEDGTMGKRAYVESGVKAGVRVEAGAGGANAKGGLHVSTGRHLRGEADGEGGGALPSKQTHMIGKLGPEKTRKGRGVTALSFAASVKAGPVSLGGSVSLKRFEKLPGEDHHEWWLSIEVEGKLGVADQGEVVARITSGIASVANLVAQMRMLYEKHKKGEAQAQHGARAGGALGDGGLSVAQLGIQGAQGSAAMARDGLAKNVVFGGESKIKFSVGKRGSSPLSLTCDIFQAKVLQLGPSGLIEVGGATAKMSASKRLVQFTFLPELQIPETPFYDKKGD